MKTPGKLAVSFIGVVLVLGLINAQEKFIAAEPVTALPAFDLPLLAASAVPAAGTFYFAFETQETEQGYPPMPFNPLVEFGFSVYSLGANMFLVDNRAFSLAQFAQAQKALKQLEVMSSGGPPPLGEDEGGGGEWTNYYSAPLYGSNDLYLVLDPASFTNGTGNLLIHYPEPYTNSFTNWYVYGTTNLGMPTGYGVLNVTNWVWVASTTTNATNVTVNLLSSCEAYFRLSSSLDLDGDGLPDDWEWAHFGTVPQGAADDFDGDNISNGDEYTNSTDPNSISFTAHIGYGQVATRTPTATISVLGGVPSSYAVFVDSTNFDNPNWQPFTASPTVTLPDADGGHFVWVALRGRVNATDWQGFGVTLDRVAPALILTSPTSGTTSKPVLQVTGYSTDALWSVSCTLSNTAGVDTNLSAFVTGRDFGAATTNHFQCFDVELTNGVNAVTVRVSDLAGNMTTTNFNVTFDTTDDSNAPVLAVVWPQEGAKLGADTFTLRGLMDDETATVQVEITSTNGATNLFFGTVERNGSVWVEGIALEPGTNWLTITAIDAATNSFMTNLTVVRSDVTLTMEDPSNLNDPFVTVNGTLSGGNYAVWVNGIQATLNGSSWTASDVPVTKGGVAVFAVRAIPSGGSNTPGTSEDPTLNNPVDPDAIDMGGQPEKNAAVTLLHKKWEQHQQWTDHLLDPYFGAGVALETIRTTWEWNQATGGYGETEGEATAPEWVVFLWPNRWGTRHWRSVAGAEHTERWEDWGGVITTNVNTSLTSGEALYYAANEGLSQGRWGLGQESHYTDAGVEHWATYAENWQSSSDLELTTGGMAGRDREGVIRLTASAQEKLPDGAMRTVPPPQIAVPGFGNLNSNGTVDKPKPEGTTSAFQLQVPANYNTETASAGKYKLHIRFPNYPLELAGATNQTTAGICMKLQVLLLEAAGSVSLSITNVQWTISGTAISNYIATASLGKVEPEFVRTNSQVNFCWIDGGLKTASCVVRVGGETLTAWTTFDVDKPPVTMYDPAIGSIVEVSTNRFQPRNALYLGYNATNHPGFIWSTGLNPDETKYAWVQVIESSTRRLKKVGQWQRLVVPGTNIVFGLDNSFPAKNGVWRKWFDDSPSVSGAVVETQAEEDLDGQYSEAVVDETYSTYLIGHPTGNDATGIWVPFYRSSWGWSGHATNGASGWGLASGTTNFVPAVATSTHPQWTNCVTVGNTNTIRWMYE